MLNKTLATAEAPPAGTAEPGPVALQPRDVRFDWSGLPLRWIPGEPQASHLLSVLHLLLPEGERWFVSTFKRALPLITDAALREDVIGFIGQEAIHAEAHQGVLDYYASAGVDTTGYIRQVEWLFRRILAPRPDLTPAGQRELLIEQVGIVAAAEHFTAMMGAWVLDATALDEVDLDPRMLDLLRWHGSEEVEHRHVAFDLMTHLDPSYIRRVRSLLLVAPILAIMWARGGKYFAAADENQDFRLTWRTYFDAARRGLLPTPGAFARCTLRWFKRGYHPSQDYSTAKCVAYLGSSPAARAAAR
ncbi:MAG: metal-dependent hydrolase [Nocardiopsaceae bacterium]|nr:metal-dependent hydrolase [Nocardiopsaceae bacterium]